MSEKIITKTYRCIRYTDFHAEIPYKGSVMEVHFSGGIRSPKLIPGSFTTTSQSLQEAIENAPAYGKKYVLFRTYESEAPKNKPRPQVKKDQFAYESPVTGPQPSPGRPATPRPQPKAAEEVEISGPQPKHEIEDPNDDMVNVPVKTTAPEDDLATSPEPEQKDPVIVEGITSGQKARNYLKDIEGITMNMLRNNNDILKVAKEHNIEFPDWQK